jgi:DNA polymerase-3 subunit alpha
MRYGSDQFYVRKPEEMYQLFPEHADAVKRSQEIADGVDIKLDFKKRHFPVFTPPGKKKPEDYLRDLCEAGLKDRYGAKPPKAAVERLELELGIICRMGFASYFLIVWDFVRFAREQAIPCSARGSACGALVSFVLRLSHVDPLEYDLLFERFLDPNRSEAPDIDIDFCQDRREEVIAYVRKKYGEESVAQIGTFGTMAARAAIKDVGRVMDVPLERVNRLTNFVPKVLNISLDEALQQSPDLKKEYDSDPQVRELIDIARKLEGTNRNAGTHAAGVVIANGPLTAHVPLQRVVRKGEDGATKNGEAVVTTQWVMGDLEKVGLLKMDFLGLRTLTLLENAVRLIEKTRGIKIDLFDLPLDDKKTYALLHKGDAKGVFQLESDGIRELLKRLRPDNIRDIVALIALYRPGPLQGGMVDAYVNCKHGREKPSYPHAVMEQVLVETHGVMVYQEQIMRILNRLGGIELSSAYACIKAISKKKQEIIDQRREDFVKGAQKQGLDQRTCSEIWDKIVVFAGYGFNKSHSAAYAQVGYQTAYLKAHYTAEFMAALLSSEIEDGNKRDSMVEHFDDARRLGVEVLPPDINAGDVEFTVADGKIVFGLCAIKGVGRGCCEEIVRARQEKGPFRDIFDFCERVDLKIVQRSALEKLVKAGAFDVMGARRAQLYAVLPAALQVAQETQQDRRKGQGSLFESSNGTEDTAAPASLPDIPEWPNGEMLKYEKEALDFYFSSHPLAQHAQDIHGFSTHSTTQLAEVGPNQEVVIGGMLTQVRLQNTKKPGRNGHSRYARCKLEDLEGAVECVMWPDDFVRYKDEFTEDRICFVKAQVERVREEPSLRLLHLLSIEQAKRELTRGLLISLPSGELSPGAMDGVGLILQRARGSCPVFLSVRDGTGKRAVLKLASDYNVNPATVSMAELESLLGSGRVGFTGLGNGKK